MNYFQMWIWIIKMIIKEQNNHNQSHCAYDCARVRVSTSHTKIHVLCMVQSTIWQTDKKARERKEMLSIEKSFEIFLMIYKYREIQHKAGSPSNQQVYWCSTVCLCVCVQNLTVKLQWVISANLVEFFDFEQNFHLKWPEPIKITYTQTNHNLFRIGILFMRLDKQQHYEEDEKSEWKKVIENISYHLIFRLDMKNGQNYCCVRSKPS